MLSKQFIHTLNARVKKVEQATDAELVTVLAPASDGYRFIPTLWAALLAMLTPLVLHELGLWLAWHDVLMIQWGVWLLLTLLFQWRPIKMLLVPASVKRHRASLMARLQFIEQGLHRTRERLGVLIFVSVAEHYVEILVDDGVAQHIDNQVWQEIIDDFVAEVRRGKVEDGFVECVRRTGEVLADAFPPTHDRNELSDDLVVLDQP
ncbi:TPM domain-containing protein [Aeromonas schubertii]|uniref:TPM domain-containing protein n=1 Tax=Aeromonas TaxID=642 RepID=UPI0010A8F5E5|nr:TPM domain-containing protein [Aeromonas schubertii]QCG47977.1 hypothetical protein E2P79_09105 [Aeromonas schubertii]